LPSRQRARRNLRAVPAASVVIVGSANLDQVFRVRAIPAPGETVLSLGFSTAPGGKGQNQAVAAARAGASTAFIGAVGADAFGGVVRASLVEAGVDVSLLRTASAPTGTALIAVDDSGENSIIVEAGANALLSGVTEQDASALRAADYLVMQLEIPLDTVAEAARIASAAATTVVLNAAPVTTLPEALLGDVDILVVNEHEAALLAHGRDLADLAPVVIVTHGELGAVLHRAGVGDSVVPAPNVEAVDTTGAGDTFCGALVAALSRGEALEEAVGFAVTAASLSVQRAGAVPSIPFRHEIDAAR